MDNPQDEPPSGAADEPARPRRSWRSWRDGPGWLQEGSSPDYRYTLANERTFLAWIRTALALLAGSVALVQFVPTVNVPGGRVAVGGLLAVTGTVLAGRSYLDWSANERAMRHAQPLPFSMLVPFLAIAVTVLGLGIVILALFHR